jgi:hypothetical protein
MNVMGALLRENKNHRSEIQKLEAQLKRVEAKGKKWHGR